MSIYLSAVLGGNRKGRFLQSVVGAKLLTTDWLSSPPTSGLLLVQGEELVDADVLQLLYQWAMQTGCAALIVNPQANQLVLLEQLSTPLDWQLIPATFNAKETGGLIALLASETDQAIVGFAGSADRCQHQTGDAVHTRFVRKHSNSGLFAITTLPLWSLSLLDHAEILINWLKWFIDHAGIVEPITEHKAELTDYIPDKQDLVVLLLLYAGHGMTLQALAEHDAVKLMFEIDSLDIVKRGDVLQQYGFINDTGVTVAGKASLQTSQYWVYAPLLSEQLTTGAL